MICLNWWVLTVKPISKAPCALTAVMVAITSVLYLIFGSQQCGTQEFIDGNIGEPYKVPYPNKYSFVLDHPTKCKHNPFLVIIIPVAPNDVTERNAIRNTWGQETMVQERHVVVLFLMGLPSGETAKIQQARLHQENTRYQDILQSNFIDSQLNQTIKTMMMLEWMRDRCSQAYYAAKVNSDMLFNIRSLISVLLATNPPQSNYFIAELRRNRPVIRSPSSKFHVPVEVFSGSVFPPYPSGKFYLMSMDIPGKILMASREIPVIDKDDLYIGLCLKLLDISPKNLPNPTRFVFVSPQQYDRCYYSNLIAVITYTPAQMVSIWTDVHKPGQACTAFN